MAAKKRVLIIDDDDDFRSSVTSLLESEGYEVSGADSGHEGLRRLRTVHPDLVVLDIMMENVTEGYAVNQAIKFQPSFAELASVPVLMVSSITETPDELFGRAGEVDMIRPDRYLTKPLDIPRFLEVVAQITSRN
jgi:CheY-like chemotaxis protein